MAAKDMAAQGEKTRAKVLKALGKKPKSAADVASKVGISIGLARKILMGFAGNRHVACGKRGNVNLFSVPYVPQQDKDQWREKVDKVLSSTGP